MSHLLQERAVHVVGIGMHPYQFPGDTPYVQLGLTAVRESLRDAGLAWPQVQAAYVGTAAIGMAAGRVMLRHLGSTGLEVTQIENASASGSSAFRLACLAVASGQHEVVLAVGVDKFGHGLRASGSDGLSSLSPTATVPVSKFALLARRYLRDAGLSVESMARVAVKNHGNAALNPYAQFRKPRSLEQVLASPKVAGELTVQQCCPRGEGAAAVIVASDAAITRLGLARSRAVRVTASVSTSERLGQGDTPPIVDLVRESAAVERRHGKIVSIMSEAGRVGEAHLAVYSGAKAAILGFSKAIAQEHGRDCINVNVIALGAVSHEGIKDGALAPSSTPENNERLAKMLKAYPISRGLNRLARPEDVSGMVAFLASDRAAFITGQSIGVSGGYTML